MTAKELKKLNRYQLLELLIEQTQRADYLQQRIEELEYELQDMQYRLEDRNLKLSQLGSIADASLQITGVLEAAQQAADIYLASAKKQAIDILEDAYQQSTSIYIQAETRSRGNSAEPMQSDWNTEAETQKTYEDETT